MNYTVLNNQRVKVSGLSMGTWAFSGAAVWGACDEQDAIRTIHRALDEGINLIDTAAVYGDGAAEQVVGRALKDRRDRALLATKVYSNNLDYKGVIRSCEDSLQRLQTDYLDIFQIHWPNPDIPAEETFSAFEHLKREGKVRMISVCNYGLKSMEALKPYDVVLNQMPYSLVWRLAEYQISPVMKEKDIKIWAYSPLGQGLLTGKYKTLEDVPVNRRATRIYSSRWGAGRHTDGGFETEVFDFLNKLRGVCDESGFSMPELAMAFLKSRDNMGSILVGSRNEKQLEANLHAYEAKVPADVVAEIDRLSLELRGKMGTNADLWENGNGGKGRFY